MFIFFKERVGILLIIKKPTKRTINKFKYLLLNSTKLNSKYKNSGTKTIPAAAGEGMPTKYSLSSIGLFVIYISAVNLAKRKAAQITKNKVAAQPIDDNVFVLHKKIKTLGATPNETKSLKESSSAPKLLPSLSFLANHPSKNQKLMPIKLNILQFSNLRKKKI